MKTVLKDQQVTHRGKSKTVTIEEYTRGGIKSPTLSIFVFEGKRITPYMQRLDEWKITFSDALKNYLPIELIAAGWKSSRSLFDMIPKNENWTGASLPIPFTRGEKNE